MIKKILAVFLVLIIVLIKKIFIRKHQVPHKLMDPIANKLHSFFLFSSLGGLYLSSANIKIFNYSLDSIIYIVLFLQLVIVIRYFNPKMLIEKPLQIKIMRTISKFTLFIFIFNWIVFTFGFAFVFLLFGFLNYGFYIFIINQIKNQKEQEEFKQHFGEGNYSKEDIVKTHILNLFEKDIPMESLTKSDIKKQYRTMAKKYHPDVAKENDKDKFASINTSYRYLLDLVQ